MIQIYFLFFFTLFLRFLDYLYYKNSHDILVLLKLTPYERSKPQCQYYKKYDFLFSVFPFIWSWLDIIICAYLIKNYDYLLLKFFVIIFIGTRMRALQEASHTAVHCGLCKSKAWQWWLSNIFFQFPFFKPDMSARFQAHVVEHHRHPNKIKDPNITRLMSIGIVPGISKVKFYTKLFHPVTLKGFMETFHLCLCGLLNNKHYYYVYIRLFVISVIGLSCYYTFGLNGFLFCYIIPLLTTYPLYSWVSLLAEHRWYAPCHATDRYTLECINGRPTNFVNLSGWIIKHAIFPGTDHYHLAHSLYPFARWNYMASIDRVLKKNADYTRFMSTGLIFKKKHEYSALSELRDRLIYPDGNNLSDWALTIFLVGKNE